MSLRGKALLIILGALLIFFGILFFLSQTILVESYEVAEREAMTRDVKRVGNEIEKQLDALDLIVVDYANWDDSYDFVLGNQPDYPSNVWTASIQLNLDVDVVIYTDLDRQLVFSQALDRIQNNLRPLNSSEQAIPQEIALFRHTNANDSVHGIVMVDGKAMLVTSKPILNNAATPPPVGYLLFDKYLTDDLVTKMSRNLELEFKVFQVDKTLPSYVIDAKNQLSETSPQYVVFLNDTLMQGYGWIADIKGEPVLISQVTERRIIFQQGRATIELFIVIAAITGLVVLGLLSLWIEWAILSPLNQLSAQVTQVTGENKTGRLNIRRRDEFGRLGENINAMLQRIEESRQTVTESQNIASEKSEKLERVQDLLTLTLDQVDDVIKERANLNDLATYVSYAKRQLKALDKTP
jgi:sensor domain CHASE-containing protein